MAGDRKAPAHLVAGLQRIDPTLELVCVGEGKWVVLSHKPRIHRIRTGHGLLRTTAQSDHPDPGVFRQGHAMVNGYAFLAEYVIEGEPDWRIVEEVRAADWLFRHQPDVCERKMAPVSDEAIAETYRNRMAQVDVRDIYRKHVRRKRTIYSY